MIPLLIGILAMPQDGSPPRKIPPPNTATGRAAAGWPAKAAPRGDGALPACAAGLKAGQAMTPDLRAQLTGGTAKVRILRPNDMATMDLVPDRLNIYLDAQNRIERITCG